MSMPLVSSLAVLPLTQTDAPDAEFPPDDERNRHSVAKVSKFVQRQQIRSKARLSGSVAFLSQMARESWIV